MADIPPLATDLANAIEELLEGKDSAAVVYALGMVVAHGVAQQEHRDVDAAMQNLRGIVTAELARQWPDGGPG